MSGVVAGLPRCLQCNAGQMYNGSSVLVLHFHMLSVHSAFFISQVPLDLLAKLTCTSEAAKELHALVELVARLIKAAPGRTADPRITC